MTVTNYDHIKVLISISKPQHQELLRQLIPHLDSITDDEYRDLVVGIRAGTITDLSYLSNRDTRIDI